MGKHLRNLFYLSFLIIMVAAFIRFNLQTDLSQFAVGRAIQESSGVERGDIVLTVSASGAAQAGQQTQLTFSSLGRVSTINVAEGDHVLAGQTLAVLDTSAQALGLRAAQNALLAQRAALAALSAAPREADVNAANAAVSAAQAQVAAAAIGTSSTQIKIAELQLEIAKNQLWQAQLSRDLTAGATADGSSGLLDQLYGLVGQLPEDQREQALNILNAVNAGLAASTSALRPSAQSLSANITNAEQNIEVASAQVSQVKSQGPNPASLAQAQAALLSAQNGLDRLLQGADDKQIAVVQAQLEAAQAALDLASYNLTLGTMTAPFSGVVAQINLVTGEPAPLNRAGIVLIDDTSFFVDVPVDESDIAQVKIDQSVILAFDALPGQPIQGKVTRIADSAVNLAGVVTYLVRVEIKDASGTIRAGMTATATITTNSIKDAIRVRNRFIRLDRKTDRAYVEVQSVDGQIREVEVKLGLRNETYSEVISGLSPGDVVVLRPRANTLF